MKMHPTLMNFSKAHYFHTFARNMCWVITKKQLKHSKTFLISYNAATDLINTFLKVSEIIHFLSYAVQYKAFKLCFFLFMFYKTSLEQYTLSYSQ